MNQAAIDGVTDQLGDHLGHYLEYQERKCLLCPALCTSDQGIIHHFINRHYEVYLALVDWQEQGEPAMPIRTRASNRQVYLQMRLWGWTEEKKTNLEVVMRHPNGSTLKVHAPENHAHNEPPVLIAIYQMTGVSPEEFWDKPPSPDEVHFASPDIEAPDQPVRNQSTQLLDLLIGQNRPLTVQWMAEATGLTHEQVQRGMNYMKNKRLVKRVKRGMWQAIDHREVTEHQTVGIEVATDEHQPAQVPASQETPVESVQPSADVIDAQSHPVPVPHAVVGREVTDAEILQVLDLLVPDGFKAVHYPAVNAWVEVTKQLVQALRTEK
jgi:hypothetical protein